MANKQIGSLPQSQSIDDDSLFVMEQQGTAQKVTGEQIKGYAKKSAQEQAELAQEYAQQSQEAAEAAEAAITQIGTAVEDTQAAQAASEAAQAAAESAQDAAETAQGQAQTAANQAGQSATAAGNAQTAAEAAQDAAEDARDLAEGYSTAAAGSASTAAQMATQAGESATVAAGSASTASQAATDAQEAKTDAETAKAGAETARAGAEAAQEAIENLGVAGQTLSPGSQVTVTKTVSPEGVVTLTFGIPQGQQGNKGDPGSSVASTKRISGTGAPGTIDTWALYNEDGEQVGTYTVYNGADGTGTGDFMSSGSVPMAGNLQMGGNRITGMAEPTADTDGATKKYVDDAVAGVEITTDETPTQGSTNPVQSGGVYTSLEGKQDTLTGQQGQVVGFDEQGNAVAQDAPDTGVTTFNGRTGAVSPQNGDYTAEMVGAVPTERTVNGHALSADVTLDAGDVGARPYNWTPSAEDVGAVPTSRTVNGKALSSNITLTADDVGAGPESTAQTITLFATLWSVSGSIYQQVATVTGVTADTPVIIVEPSLSTTDVDANETILEAWNKIAKLEMTQGAGTITFRATEHPGVHVPVKVGVC